ncbi:hypothetical protein CUU62_27255 [Pseudomonas sp. WP001]|uniref:Uncharacterized protein n=1 Tax=Pseudomonas orientalis TaxID=76758 RepID=A0A4Q7D0W8_9PSED|nr:hypothetical protein CUU62_27255 [Pseudomonas sp. WP001]RZI32356.1 hypothetical protein EUX57_07460 [Pseudomonas orientalis]
MVLHRRRVTWRRISSAGTRPSSIQALIVSTVSKSTQAPDATVGASLLAKNSNAPRSYRMPALSLTFFASKLAPTGKS